MNDADWALQALICYRDCCSYDVASRTRSRGGVLFCSGVERPRKEVEEEGTKTPRVKTPTTAHH
eukprot:scaffold693_cov200-Alexandrium_tamarense.AAC.53